jgi:ankyrin repeat protein
MLNSIDKHDYDYLYYLLDFYSPIDCSHTPPLRFVSSLKHRYTIKSLGTTAERVPPQNRESMLHVAVKNNDIRIVKFLLDKGLDPNIKGQLALKSKVFNDVTPLHLASYFGFNDIVNILLNAGANPNECCYKIVEPDTMRQGNIGNEITLFNLSPLHFAAFNGQIEVIKLLLSNNGISGNFSIIDGKNILEEGNILHLAALKAHREIIEFIQKENLIFSKQRTFEFLNKAE